MRKLRALGLALVAMAVMGAISASVASAGEITSDGTVFDVTATETEATLTAFGNQSVKCEALYTVGNVNETPHKKLTVPTKEVTVAPDYSKCSGFIGGTTAGPATVTMNGCDFDLKVGGKISAGKYKGTARITCTGTNQIEVHLYTNSTHASTICTYKIPAQENLEGGFVENSGGSLKLGGPVTGIRASKTGLLCGGTAETTEAVQDISTTASGKNEALTETTGMEVTGE